MVISCSLCQLKTDIRRLRTFATDAPGELNVLGHDGHTLGVDSTQVGVLEKTNEVCLGSLLKCQYGRSLETKITLEILGDFANKSLEGKLADENFSRFLVTMDLTKGNGSGAVTVGLFHTSCGGGGLTSSLGCELLAGSFSSGGFACGLLGTSHFELLWFTFGKFVRQQTDFAQQVMKSA